MLHPEGSSCLSFQPDPLCLLLILKIQPEGSSRLSFQPYHFIILLTLKLHPYGNSCFSFQPKTSESCLEVPFCRQLLTLLVSKTAQHSTNFECPSLRQLQALLPAGPPLIFLNISYNIFFKDTIQSSAIILIDNHFFTFFNYLVNLSENLPFKITV